MNDRGYVSFASFAGKTLIEGHWIEQDDECHSLLDTFVCKSRKQTTMSHTAQDDAVASVAASVTTIANVPIKDGETQQDELEQEDRCKRDCETKKRRHACDDKLDGESSQTKTIRLTEKSQCKDSGNEVLCANEEDKDVDEVGEDDPSTDRIKVGAKLVLPCPPFASNRVGTIVEVKTEKVHVVARGQSQTIHVYLKNGPSTLKRIEDYESLRAAEVGAQQRS